MKSKPTIFEDIYETLLDIQLKEIKSGLPGLISYDNLKRIFKKRYENGDVFHKTLLGESKPYCSLKVLEERGFINRVAEKDVLWFCTVVCNKNKGGSVQCLSSSKGCERGVYPSRFKDEAYVASGSGREKKKGSTLYLPNLITRVSD
ncbi:MAG: hypothetical protein JSV92_00090 [archaeon]|nr:MAG: hypothetical protein JSV92_00090 [archaeon]